MAAQVQQSSFAKKLGGQIAAANAECMDKPVDTGMRRLPAIENGVAKIATMMTKEYEDDKNGPGTKGQTYFHARAVIVWPTESNGVHVEGMQTAVTIPLCEMPAKGLRKAKSFMENWFNFQNLFKLLGVAAPRYTPKDDPTGEKTEAYFFAAMKSLTDPKKPTYISFSVREWSPKATKEDPNPEKRSQETWHGLADPTKIAPHNPAAGVTVNSNGPPVMAADGFPANPSQATSSQVGEEPDDPTDTDDVMNNIDALVAIALEDPEAQTEEGEIATDRLTELAVAAGWTEEQVLEAPNWTVVGEMALHGPAEANFSATEPKVGMTAKFCKRDKEGDKLKNKRTGQPFAPLDVVVTTVNTADGTCTVKTTKDGKEVIDLATKKPVAVKFEWLE